MLIAYVDESYDKDFYYMGAAIGAPEQWERVESAFETIRFLTNDAHGTPLDVELHAHEIMGGSGDWAPLRGKHREAAGVYIAALRAVKAAGISYIFRGVNVARLNARYSYPYSPHKVAFGHLLERINGFTVYTSQAEPTIVVADQIATQDEHQRAFAGYQEFGTGGYRSSTLDMIDPPINFADSAGSDGLQAVDLATYVHFRRERVTTAHPAAQRTLTRQWAEIHPQVHHSWDWWP